MHPYNKLWVKGSYAKIPNIGERDGKGDDAIAFVKIFSNRSDQRWYILEYDPETGRAFCLHTQHGKSSFGYSIINEVHPGDYEVEDRGGIMQWVNDTMRFPPYERDSSFQPTRVGKIKEKAKTSCPA